MSENPASMNFGLFMDQIVPFAWSNDLQVETHEENIFRIPEFGIIGFFVGSMMGYSHEYKGCCYSYGFDDAEKMGESVMSSIHHAWVTFHEEGENND